ncbi:MAG: hypothetical protein ACLFP2_00920 [Candidatus Woesearchaeota archaeon]
MGLKGLLQEYCKYNETRVRQKKIGHILSGKPLGMKSIPIRKSKDLRYWTASQERLDELHRRLTLYLDDAEPVKKLFPDIYTSKRMIKKYTTNTFKVFHLSDDLSDKLGDFQYMATSSSTIPNLLYQKTKEIITRKDNVTGYRIKGKDLEYPINDFLHDLFGSGETINAKRWHNSLIQKARRGHADWLTRMHLKGTPELTVASNDPIIPGMWHLYPGQDIFLEEKLDEMNKELSQYNCSIQTKTFQIR